MASYTISPIWGAGAQLFDNNGDPLSGGKVYVYSAGTTTPAVTYTDPTGSVPNTNPIIADAAGRLPNEIWFLVGRSYKFVLKTSTDVLLATYDNIPSAPQPAVANDASSTYYEPGYQVTAGGFTVGQVYLINSVGNTNFVAIGAASNTVGVYFTATGVGSGTGTALYARTVQSKLRENLSVKDFGAVGDGVTDDRLAFQSAANAGVAISVPSGTYNLSDYITLANGSEFFGPRNAVLQSTGLDKAIFFANGLEWFRISGLTLKGNAASPASPALVQNRAAITVWNTTDCMVDDCLFQQWHGSGVSFSRQGTKAAGKVIGNTFIKGDMSATGTSFGIQDNAPVQLYQYARNVIIANNESYGPWYCAVLLQDQVNTGFSAIKDVVIDGNKFYDLSQYGFVFYTLDGIVPSSYTDNGAGAYRVTCTANHGLETGAWITLRGSTGTANGYWQITKINDNTFDLNGSVYAPTTVTNDRVFPAVSCSAVVSNNIIDGVQGDREVSPGNRPYGAGIYVQGAGTINCTGNIFRRTNLSTNSQTLTPASIGVNAASGPFTVNGNLVEACGYEAVSLKCYTQYAPIIVSGLQITGVINSTAVRIQDGYNVSIDSVQILPGPNSLGGRFVAGLSNASKAYDVYIRNVSYPAYSCVSSTNAFEIADTDGFSFIGCTIRNLKPASQSFECLRILRCDNGVVANNYIDGKASAYIAGVFTSVTNTVIDGNYFRMTADGAARETVLMSGTCTGTTFMNTNIDNDGRMGNTSTGGKMHTRSDNNLSGGKTRQIGDSIVNTSPTAAGTAMWVKIAVSSGGSDWQRLILAP